MSITQDEERNLNLILKIEDQNVLSCTQNSCIMTGESKALLFPLLGSVYGCPVDRGWTMKALSHINLAKKNYISQIICMLPVRVGPHKILPKDWKAKMKQQLCFTLERMIQVRIPFVDHIFVQLLVPLVGNGSSQTHSLSYQGHISAASLISGPGTKGTLWQEFYFSHRSFMTANLSLKVDKILHGFQSEKGNLQLPCCFHIAICLHFSSSHSLFLPDQVSYDLRISTRRQRHS